MMDELRELYQEVILDHSKHPRNKRHPHDANREAHGDNPLCGDRITVFLKLAPDGTVEDVAFDGRGCAISTASASLMTEIVKGRRADEVKQIFEHFHEMCTSDGYDASVPDAVDPDAFDRLQVLAGVRQFPMRVKCATLAWHTLNAAMAGEEKVTTE